MMKEFFTQSHNFIGSQQTGIDPRTGVFTASLLLAQFQANYGLGPSVNFTLSSQSISTIDEGFGTGVGLPFTTYDQGRKLLRLSTGEQYQIEEDAKGVTVKQKKFSHFIFERFEEHSGAKDCYKVTYKTGQVEILEGPSSAFSLKKTVRIETSEGHYLTLAWTFAVSSSLLSISDAHHTLLSVDYRDVNAPVITVYPGFEEEYQVKLTLENRLLRYIIQENKAYTWQLNYTADRLLEYIQHPTGLEEHVVYQSSVFRFPDGAPASLKALPAAINHTKSPKNGQPDIVSSYCYTSSNFLGYGSGVIFHSDQDNLYEVLDDYSYGSIETTSEGSLIIEVERKYNRFHLNTLERMSFHSPSGVNSIEVELEYDTLIGVTFSNQPAQFQLIKKKTITWSDVQNSTRTEVHLTEFDLSGNPTQELQPNGNHTTMTRYSAQEERGCPTESNGYVRFF